jgi:hypothetical protein
MEGLIQIHGWFQSHTTGTFADQVSASSQCFQSCMDRGRSNWAGRVLNSKRICPILDASLMSILIQKLRPPNSGLTTGQRREHALPGHRIKD